MSETPSKPNEDQGLSLILVADDEPHQRSLLKRWLELDGHKVETLESAEACLQAMTQVTPNALCVDLRISDMGGLALLKQLRAAQPLLPVIMMSTDVESEDITAATRLGAYDTLTKPVDRSELVARVRSALAHAQRHSRQAPSPAQRFPDIVGASAPMMSMFKQLNKLTTSDINVLIQGGSGTGKRLIAETIHRHSERRDGPFVVINCATAPGEALVAELFGHPGDGDAPHPTHIERAHNGTLFLNELEGLHPTLQARLMGTLRQRARRDAGEGQEAWPDFRLLAATHRDLRVDIEAGHFREDLFYHVAVFELHVSRLRERGADVPLLTRHFVKKFADDQRRAEVQITPEAMTLFQEYPWPGNVRELQNAIQHALLMSDGEHITPDDLPPALRIAAVNTGPPDAEATAAAPESPNAPPTSDLLALDATRERGGSGGDDDQTGTRWRLPAMTLEELEEIAIKEALERCEGNAAEVIGQLGLSRATFYRKIKKYGLK